MAEFVFLIKLTEAAGRQIKQLPDKLVADAEEGQKLGFKSIEFRALTGEYDLIALAKGGGTKAAFEFALYLAETGDYETKTLNSFSLAELVGALKPVPDVVKKRP
jgi:uncharacterized protein with GYD domain